MRCCIAVVEGVEKSLLLEEIDQGNLPWFENAMATGKFLPLNCGPVPYEPSNLTTAFSGVGPGYHGCYSYWEIHTPEGPPRVLETKDVKVPRIWEWPEMKGLPFSVVNVQLTHPPQPLDGFLVSYPMQQTLHATYPKDLQVQLARLGIRYAHDVSVFYAGEPLEEYAKNIKRVAEFQFDTILNMARRSEILIANLTIVDRLSHFLWSEIAHGNSRYIRESYRFLDNALNRLESLMDDSGTLIVFSELGFGPIKEFVSIDKMLQEKKIQTLDRNGDIIFSRTLAREAVQGSHGINLVNGSSQPWKQSDYDRQVEEVCSILLELKFPEGTPIIQSARPREEVYQGSYVHLAPDIIISPADLERPPLGNPYWAKHVHRHFQTGWHRDTGFVLLKGKPVKGDPSQTVELQSIAPTIAHALDRDIPKFCRAPSLFS